MTKFVIEREHALSIVECREISKSIADSLIHSYGGSKIVSCNEVHYHHMGGSSGLIIFDESKLKVKVELSFMMSALKPLLKKQIMMQCDKRLS